MSRVLPHNLDAEAVVLSTMILQPETIDEIREVCDEHSFYSEANKTIFEAALSLHDKGDVVDMQRVATRLQADDNLRKVGGMPYIAQVIDATPGVANYMAHARTCQDFGRLRRAIQTHTKFAALGYGDLSDPKRQLDDRERVQNYLNQSLAELTDVAYQRQADKLQHISGVLHQVHSDIVKATQAQGKITGITTGFVGLDNQLTGVHDGDVTIVASRPGMGKTALALCMAKRMAEKGHAAPFFSLEMPATQLVARLVSMEADIDLKLLRSGQFDPNRGWKKITDAMNRLAQLPIFIDDTPGITVLDVRGRTRVLQRRIVAGKEPTCQTGRVGAAFIDYLQLMRSVTKKLKREEEVASTSQATKLTAKELGIPLVVLSQLNREPEKRKDHRPELSDLRESGSLEQDADNVLFVFRPGYYQPDEPDLERRAEVIVAKQRNGPTGTIELAFKPETARFENLHDDDGPEEYDPAADVAEGIPNGLA